MTLDKAKQLKPGDSVLVLVELVARSKADPDHWHGKTRVERLCLCPEDIHSVYKPAHREFCKGDIVINKYGDLYICLSNEKDGSVKLISNGIITFCENCHKRYLLVCPAKARLDTKVTKTWYTSS